MDLAERRLQELAAVAAIYGVEALGDVPQHWQQGLAVLESNDTEAMRAWCSAHADEPCSLRLSLGQADLLATLPGRYPGAAGQPAQVVVASASLSRVQAAELSQQLQQQADAAATTGRECVFELAGALEGALVQLQQRQEAGPSACSARGDETLVAAGRVEGDQLQVALLQLHHMRDRSGYSKAIKRWAALLGLTGRLLFCQALILILLEGSPPSLKEYLRLQRTVTVDVDAAGRKCRERMMDVVMMRDVVMMGDAQPQQRCFHDFREQELESYQSLAELLGPATGLGLQDVQALAGRQHSS